MKAIRYSDPQILSILRQAEGEGIGWQNCAVNTA